MKASGLCLWMFVSFEACLCLVILLKFLPAALKAKSVLGFAGTLAVAMPWSLLVGAGIAVGQWALRKNRA